MAETKNDLAEGQGSEAAGRPAKKVTKMEAVRRALRELGKDASGTDIQDFARDHFSLDVPPELGKKYKSDILRKAKKAPEKISKKEGVRRALAELGNDATPSQIRDYAKEHYGLEMSASHASATKGEFLRAAERAAGSQAPEPQAPPAEPAQPALAEAGDGRGIALDDVLLLKDLADRVGADQLRRLIDVMAR
jgi:hypothetical protein